ncbi:hypothetical protein Pan97_40060 [Bremerella volcania]|uniref:Uncharacterized protein n=1 Tax=Bremerella volcania TaxID=2527984 RepID=A0A518CCJ3_9BACT|nr:hypothetical protein [Bremerella volcania]QDU76948.1 hypothetical protein Pan97_40060 [Bremerella volcania]
MPSFTQLGAFKTLSHQLQLYEFPECEKSGALEAFLYVRARIEDLKNNADLQASYHQEGVGRFEDEFHFVDLVLERLRTFIDLKRPLQPVEMASAMSALQFLARRLMIPYEDWDFDHSGAPDLADLLVGRARPHAYTGSGPISQQLSSTCRLT